MRILVTGPGRLGRPLIAKLHRHGIIGAVLHRSASASLPSGWRSIRADVTCPESLAGICTDCDQVLHLAAVTHTNRSARYAEVNALGTLNLVAEARRAGVQRFTLVSTRAISPAGGAYSRSKIQAEEIVRDSGLAWNILRPAEVYGMGDGAGGEGVTMLIERCRQGRWVPVAGDGSARLAPVYLDDVIDGMCRAVTATGHGGVHVLAGPEEMTYLQLIRRLAAYFHTRPRTISVPASLLALAARALALLPLDRPPLYADQVARLFSPKSHDTESAFLAFGFTARPLEQGLNALFHPRPGAAA
ncbi:MAG TPA: NAD-dependent epimerase/dehydratase family protein [Thermoanaerobaculia bacterium]|jgi:NADH dehydrogenase|nr:NAD-dependent epimerase/dehydratase family protein [Thermoanaerobaculia bacterium]